MIQWYKKVVLENYANFNGRSRRAEFWWYTLANIIMAVIAMTLDSVLGTNIEPANKLEILSIIEKYYPHVKVLQAKIKKAEFGLDLIPL